MFISFRKQPQENTRADWLKIVFLSLAGNRKLARTIDVMMARAKRILHFDDQSKEVFSPCFFCAVF